jgi:hypothetical protein
MGQAVIRWGLHSMEEPGELGIQVDCRQSSKRMSRGSTPVGYSMEGARIVPPPCSRPPEDRIGYHAAGDPIAGGLSSSLSFRTRGTKADGEPRTRLLQ